MNLGQGQSPLGQTRGGQVGRVRHQRQSHRGGAVSAQPVPEAVQEDAAKPAPQRPVTAPLRLPGQRRLQRVLDKIIRQLAVTRQGLCKGAQARNGGFDLVQIRHCRPQYLTTCQTPFTPSPVMSPGFWSLIQR